MKYKHSICWIRRDLRLNDQRSITAAKLNSENVTVVFVFDKNILDKLEDRNDRRVTFIHQCLQELNNKLQSKGSQLVVLHGDPVEEIPKAVKVLQADAVYAGLDFEPQAKIRDQKVHEKLQSMGCFFHLIKDQVIFAGLEVKKQDGTPFKVFTPYKNQWLKQLQNEDTWNATTNRENYTHHDKLKIFTHDWTLKDVGFDKNTLWLEPGEHEAKFRLRRFLTVIDKYKEDRNYPWKDKGTSALSVHLRFGTISIRSCIREILEKKTEGARTWLSELIWREFYMMILDQYPHVVDGAFKEDYVKIKWPGSDSHFEKWCAGMTGYPIIDAAMRHFNKTGWMHNRLRMIVAMFLTKDLLVDWRKGEAYFARYLLDFDLSANNGGWQWCASTGCDAQPYFRIFNPVLQSEKFDAQGEYIREHCPELQGFSNKTIHAPWEASMEEQKKAKCIVGTDYPAPIVNHAQQREKVLRVFKKVI
jgi:deoxyribodipyrimidine photo-lyase